jgi:hypothetical protein
MTHIIRCYNLKQLLLICYLKNLNKLSFKEMNQLSETRTPQVCRSMQERQLLWTTETTHTHTHTHTHYIMDTAVTCISSGNITMKVIYGRHFTSHAFCFKPFTHFSTGTVMFCLAVCYLIHYSSEQALVSLLFTVHRRWPATAGYD